MDPADNICVLRQWQKNLQRLSLSLPGKSAVFYFEGTHFGLPFILATVNINIHELSLLIPLFPFSRQPLPEQALLPRAACAPAPP